MIISKSRKQSTIRFQQHRSAEPDCWFSLEKIDAAYKWLCNQRRHYPADSDIWHLRFHWSRYRNDLYQALSADSFELSPQFHIVKMDGCHLHCWSAMDGLVLKLLAWHLEVIILAISIWASAASFFRYYICGLLIMQMIVKLI